MKNSNGQSGASLLSPARYAQNLQHLLETQDWSGVDKLAAAMRDIWRSGKAVYVCGNGGSAANAIHWANDFVYPVAKNHGKALRITALTANSAVLTCLANDVGYENVFAYQLRVAATPGDLLVVLSGSGNSANILAVVRAAREMGVKTAAVLGFDGGACLEMVDIAIHSVIDDMQIAEDFQLIVNHMVMRVLAAEDPNIE